MNPTVERLVKVMNRHDAVDMAALYAPDYRSEQPVHPNRAFTGNAQVQKNWTQMFAGMPDMKVTCVAEDTVGSRSWSEWEMTGHHIDGSEFATRGVIVMGLRDDGLIQWQRLYVEPVEPESPGIEEAVQQLTKPG
jgi:ketosteroid isomerase-like protein